MNEVFISYVQGDQSVVTALKNRLESFDIKQNDITNSIKSGFTFFQAIKDVVANQRYFLTLVTDNYIKSGYAFEQYNEVIQQALLRDKIVILMVPEKLKDHQAVEYFKNNCSRVIFTGEDFGPEEILRISKEIKKIIEQVESKQYLFEKLTELKKFDQVNEISTTLNQLVHMLIKELETTVSPTKRRSVIKQIILCLRELASNNEQDFSPASQRSTTNRIHALKSIDKLYETEEFQSEDLFYLALQIYMKYLEEKIRSYCNFIITLGEVDHVPVRTLKEYSDFQYKILEKFTEEKLKQNVSYLNPAHYSDNEIKLILSIKDYLLSNKYYDQKLTLETSKLTKKSKLTAKELYEVAQTMMETNQILETLVEKRNTRSVLKALRTNYVRLKNYAEMIGATDICLNCIDEIARINSELENTSKADLKDDKFTQAVKSLLGIQILDTRPFDVFISHDESDDDIALTLYNYLKENLHDPFLDTVDLPEMLPLQLRQATRNAIQNSNNLIIVASDLNNLNNKKVKVEIDLFHYKKLLGGHRNGKMLFVLTEDVFEKVDKLYRDRLTEKYEEYDILKISSESDYKDQILSLLNL